MKFLNWLFREPKKIEATRYDAAQTTTENRRHWSLTDSLSADASQTVQVRTTLRNRSRYEVSNNSYAAGIVQTIADDCIGTGPRLQIVSDQYQQNDFDKNTQTERAFSEWSNEIRLAEKLRTMRKAKIIDGEAFAIFVNNDTLESPVKLDLKLIESDRITSPYQLWDWKELVDGIAFDDQDNPVAYYMLRYHPGDNHGNIEEYETIPAKDIIHWYRMDRPEQHRGIPELTPALPLFAQLRRYTLAVLASAETAADFAAVIYTDAPANGEATPAVPFDLISLEKRMATTLPDGWKLGQLKSEQPTTNYPQFKREILGEIGRCLQIPINIVTGDSSKHNYASGRLDHQSYQRAIRIEQDNCSHFLNRIFDAWYNEYSLESGLKRTRDFSIKWFFDGFAHVDPSKEAKAQEIRLKNCTTTLAFEYARQGLDWEEELRQIARERKLIDELGISDSQITRFLMKGASKSVDR